MTAPIQSLLKHTSQTCNIPTIFDWVKSEGHSLSLVRVGKQPRQICHNRRHALGGAFTHQKLFQSPETYILSYRYWIKFHTPFRWLRYIKTMNSYEFTILKVEFCSATRNEIVEGEVRTLFDLMHHYLHKIILFSSIYVRPSWPMHNKSICTLSLPTTYILFRKLSFYY